MFCRIEQGVLGMDEFMEPRGRWPEKVREPLARTVGVCEASYLTRARICPDADQPSPFQLDNYK
jgi:hypothetical protein